MAIILAAERHMAAGTGHAKTARELGPWRCKWSSGGEQDKAGRTGGEAVVAEGPQCAAGEIAGQEPGRQVRPYAGQQRGEQHLRADAVAEGAEQVADFEGASGEDDGGGEQKRESGGVFA